MLPSRCRRRFSLVRHGASSAFRNGGAKTAPLLERFPLGAATTVTRRGLDLGQDWTLARLDIESAGFTDVSSRL